jgi:AraC-like DNA-binding protein
VTVTEPASYGFTCLNMGSPFMDQAHQHNDIELNFAATPLSYMIGGDRVMLPPSRVAVFWASQPHQLLNADDVTPMTWLTIPLDRFLSWSMPDDATQRLLAGELIVGSQEVSDLYTRSHLVHWQHDLESRSTARREVVALEVQAFVTRLTSQPDRTPARELRPAGVALARAGDMAHYIALHCHEPLQVDDIANVVHLHPHHAMAIFKQVLGRSITGYLTQCRVGLAQRLLLTTTLPVTEVGHLAGFGSQSRFYATFTAQCALPPSAYRRHHSTGLAASPDPPV